MDFAFAEREERLRLEVRAFLREELGADWKNAGPFGARSDEVFEVARRFNAALGRRRWLAPAWPREYGGLAASIFEQMVFAEELGYFGAPDTGTRTFGVGMLGPTLLVHGTEEQRRRYLPRINSGEDIWCQGYSEPTAGSDLASLQTRAERDGDDYVINGQKIWTSGAHHANRMFCLARTNASAPRHQSMSFLIIDDLQRTAGVTIRPILNLGYHHHFNEVFFENVRVPARNLVGEENRGWYVAMTLLEFERSGIGTTAAQRRLIAQLSALLRRSAAVIRTRYRLPLADLAIANATSRYLGYRIGDLQTRGQAVVYEASAIKVLQSEMDQRLTNFALGVLGLSGQLRPEDPRAPLDGDVPESYFEAVAASIYSGTNEVQRNIIATRGVGLPRE